MTKSYIFHISVHWWSEIIRPWYKHDSFPLNIFNSLVHDDHPGFPKKIKIVKYVWAILHHAERLFRLLQTKLKFHIDCVANSGQLPLTLPDIWTNWYIMWYFLFSAIYIAIFKKKIQKSPDDLNITIWDLRIYHSSARVMSDNNYKIKIK